MADNSSIEDNLRWLVCPACHQPLELKGDPAMIRCQECSRSYPIVDGLPILLAMTTSGIQP